MIVLVIVFIFFFVEIWRIFIFFICVVFDIVVDFERIFGEGDIEKIYDYLYIVIKNIFVFFI